MRIRHRGRSSRRLLAGSALPNSFRLSRGVALACVVVLATVLATAGAAPALANPVGGQASLPACAGLDPSILSTTLPSGSVGAPYSQDVQLFGTLPPFTVAVVSGSLPPGLSVNGQTDFVHRSDLGHANHRRHVQLCAPPDRHHRESVRPAAVYRDQSGRAARIPGGEHHELADGHRGHRLQPGADCQWR